MAPKDAAQAARNLEASSSQPHAPVISRYALPEGSWRTLGHTLFRNEKSCGRRCALLCPYYAPLGECSVAVRRWPGLEDWQDSSRETPLTSVVANGPSHLDVTTFRRGGSFGRLARAVHRSRGIRNVDGAISGLARSPRPTICATTPPPSTATRSAARTGPRPRFGTTSCSSRARRNPRA